MMGIGAAGMAGVWDLTAVRSKEWRVDLDEVFNYNGSDVSWAPAQFTGQLAGGWLVGCPLVRKMD